MGDFFLTSGVCVVVSKVGIGWRMTSEEAG